MAKYIIKIDCTHINNFAFNNKYITKANIFSQNPPDLALGYLTSIFPFIESIAIVHKRVKGFTKKSLDFFCYNEDELRDEEFINFITVVKKMGFSAVNENTTISYVKISDSDGNYWHTEILKYYYNSIKKIEVDDIPKNPYHYKKGNYTYILNICKNITV